MVILALLLKNTSLPGLGKDLKVIPKIALLASLLDTRFKFGAGLGEEDKTILWRWLEEEMTATAQAQAMVVENNTNNYDAGDPQRWMHPN